MKFEVLGMQRWDKPTDRAQRADKKMELKCLENGKNQGAIALSYPLFY